MTAALISHARRIAHEATGEASDAATIEVLARMVAVLAQGASTGFLRLGEASRPIKITGETGL